MKLAAHQVEAVERLLPLLDRFGGALLADDVGLGKSYVAAAVADEHRARGFDVELIVPASLVPQWRELGFTTITHDALLSDTRWFLGASGSSRSSERSGIAEEPRHRGTEELLPRRLLVVDEAHAFRNRKTQRWSALARRSVGARLLLVTATPVCNSADDLYALISLIASDDALRAEGVASIEEAFRTRDARAIDRIVGTLVIRRERDVLPPELDFGELEMRIVRHPVPNAPIDALQFPLSTAAALLRQFLWRRLESSDAALLESVRRQLRFYDRVLESGRALTRRDYRRAFAHEEDDAYQQVLFWDLWAPETDIDREAIAREMRLLAEVRAFIEQRPSSKHELLRDVLTADPSLVFTGSVATARDLAKRLRCGLATSRDGTAAIETFRSGAIDLVVATDVAAEGLNLQRAAVVVHYDIPWNPVKLDQRNGRAHRIGQSRPSVRAIYFMPERDRTRIVETIDVKNRTRRRTLSGHAPAGSPTFLPPHLPRDSAAVALLRAIEAGGFEAPPIAGRRWRAGVELMFAEMAAESLSERKLRDLSDILRAEPSL